MRRPALRRFPSVIVRLRQAPSGPNRYGEIEPGPITRTELPALVQPIKLDDDDQEGGVAVLRRTRVWVPFGVELASTADATLSWHGDALLWGGDALLWGGAALGWGSVTGYRAGDANPLGAGFDDRGADRVEIAGDVYVVVESQNWVGSHCRADLLRET